MERILESFVREHKGNYDWKQLILRPSFNKDMFQNI